MESVIPLLEDSIGTPLLGDGAAGYKYHGKTAFQGDSQMGGTSVGATCQNSSRQTPVIQALANVAK